MIIPATPDELPADTTGQPGRAGTRPESRAWFQREPRTAGQQDVALRVFVHLTGRPPHRRPAELPGQPKKASMAYWSNRW